MYPTDRPQKTNLSNHMSWKIACSLWPTGPVLWYFWMYPDQPPMLRVSTLRSGLRSYRWLSSADDMSKPVSMSTSARVGEAGPWPNRKALRVSNHNYEATINSNSFLSISAMDSLMHCSSLRSPHWTSFELLTLKNQSLHPLVELGQDRKVPFHISKEKFSALKGILFVSAVIRSVGSGLPNGPRHWKWGRSVGIIIFSVNS